MECTICTVEKELMSWIEKVMALIEKDRDLKARIHTYIANQERTWIDMVNQDMQHKDPAHDDFEAKLIDYQRNHSLIRNHEMYNVYHAYIGLFARGIPSIMRQPQSIAPSSDAVWDVWFEYLSGYV
eukprot:644124_1